MGLKALTFEPQAGCSADQPHPGVLWGRGSKSRLVSVNADTAAERGSLQTAPLKGFPGSWRLTHFLLRHRTRAVQSNLPSVSAEGGTTAISPHGPHGIYQMSEVLRAPHLPRQAPASTPCPSSRLSAPGTLRSSCVPERRPVLSVLCTAVCRRSRTPETSKKRLEELNSIK